MALSPHISPSPDAVLLDEQSVIGHFGEFNHPEISVELPVDLALNEAFYAEAQLTSFSLRRVWGTLDYGILVPLLFTMFKDCTSNN